MWNIICGKGVNNRGLPVFCTPDSRAFHGSLLPAKPELNPLVCGCLNCLRHFCDSRHSRENHRVAKHMFWKTIGSEMPKGSLQGFKKRSRCSKFHGARDHQFFSSRLCSLILKANTQGVVLYKGAWHVSAFRVPSGSAFLEPFSEPFLPLKPTARHLLRTLLRTFCKPLLRTLQRSLLRSVLWYEPLGMQAPQLFQSVPPHAGKLGGRFGYLFFFTLRGRGEGRRSVRMGGGSPFFHWEWKEGGYPRRCRGWEGVCREGRGGLNIFAWAEAPTKKMWRNQWHP